MPKSKRLDSCVQVSTETQEQCLSSSIGFFVPSPMLFGMQRRKSQRISISTKLRENMAAFAHNARLIISTNTHNKRNTNLHHDTEIWDVMLKVNGFRFNQHQMLKRLQRKVDILSSALDYFWQREIIITAINGMGQAILLWPQHLNLAPTQQPTTMTTATAQEQKPIIEHIATIIVELGNSARGDQLTTVIPPLIFHPNPNSTASPWAEMNNALCFLEKIPDLNRENSEFTEQCLCSVTCEACFFLLARLGLWLMFYEKIGSTEKEVHVRSKNFILVAT